MSIETVAKWIEASGPAQAIAQSAWAFPAIETVHVIAIAMVVGSIAAVDLRLLNLVWKERPAGEVASELLPWTWACFVVAAIAGVLMFISAATKYVADLPFQLKMLLLVLAGANMLAFHHFTWRDVESWRRDTPAAAKIAAALSLAFWIAIVVCGRLVSFTTQDQFGPPSVSDASGVVATVQNA
jgi:putative copper export protein